jgi:hypothetical protein
VATAATPKPEPTAGYSGTPLAKKLGVTSGVALALVDAPPAWTVPDVPPDVDVTRASARSRRSPKVFEEVDVAIVFCRALADVLAAASAVPSLPPRSALWIAWPRKAGGHVSDVDENLLREVLLPTGVVDVKVAALDQDWSGLKFLWRKENRPR